MGRVAPKLIFSIVVDEASPSGTPNLLNRLACMIKVGLRFVLLATAYLAFAGQVSVDECVAAGVSAAALTLVSLVRHPAATPLFSFVPRVVVRHILAAMPKLLTDSLGMIPRLFSNARAGTMSQEFVADDGHTHDAAWWAVFTLTTSAPPNSYLISRLARHDEVIMHRLTEQRS